MRTRLGQTPVDRPPVKVVKVVVVKVVQLVHVVQVVLVVRVKCPAGEAKRFYYTRLCPVIRLVSSFSIDGPCPITEKPFSWQRRFQLRKSVDFFSILWYELPPPAGTVIPEMQNEAMAF